MGISKTKTEAKLEAIVFFPTWIQVMPLTGIPTWIQLKFACDIFFLIIVEKRKKQKQQNKNYNLKNVSQIVIGSY